MGNTLIATVARPAAQLSILSFPVLFASIVAGFLGSVLLVVIAALPARTVTERGQFWASTTKGHPDLPRRPVPARADDHGIVGRTSTHWL